MKKSKKAQGLEADAKEVEAARRHIGQLGRYGRVSVDLWNRAARLPYADNLVNLFVVSGPPSVDRVLACRLWGRVGCATMLWEPQT
jgi:hypothetical protein